MRIAHVISYYQPSFGYQETYLAKLQKEMGHEVFVVTSDRYHPGLYEKKARLVAPGMHVEDGVSVLRLKTSFEFGTRPFIRGLQKALNGLAPDVIHCHEVFSFVSVMVAWRSKKPVCPLVYDSHAADFNTDARSTRSRALAYALYRKSAGCLMKKRAYRFVAIGENESEFLCRELDLGQDKVDIIRMGADSARFVFDPAARRSCRDELGIRDGEIVVVHAGGISARKRIELLVEALSRLRKAGLDLRLLLVGRVDGGYKEKLTAASKDLGLRCRVILTGHVDRALLPRFYSASDIAVWPGDISIGAIEAMNMRLPLVAPEDDYNRELTKNGNGLVFSGGDAGGLADIISRLASDPGLRSEMGMRSRDLVLREFDWKNVAGQFVSLYSEAVRRGS